MLDQKRDRSQEVARETAQVLASEAKSTTRRIDAQKLNILAIGRGNVGRAQHLLRNATDISPWSRRFIADYLKANGKLSPSTGLANSIDRF
ncbi:hypothetical protein ACU4HD_22050 [Cupriavidus basilensis]